MTRKLSPEELYRFLARRGACFDTLKASGMLEKWEIRAIEEGHFGRLRLSSLEKLVKAICTYEEFNENKSFEVMGEILDIMTYRD